MKRVLSFLIILLAPINTIGASLGEQTQTDKSIWKSLNIQCENVKEADYPTIFIPGLAASWYSEYGYDEDKVKRWIPDPITHVYDTLFYTFKQNGYVLRDVYYKNEFTISIDENVDPQHSLYLFGYDWKKDNKITATLVTQLIGKIRETYYKKHNCDIGKVNIVSHSMGGLVARSLIENFCSENSIKGNTFEFPGAYKRNDNGEVMVSGGKIVSQKTVPCTNPYFSDTISKEIKVHKLITIATPHRGSPKAFPIWEKGDIEMTDGFIFGHTLKLQLGIYFGTDTSLYKAIHGYDSLVPNGIVGLGQLLPDISKEDIYNKELQYISENRIISPGLDIYPENSFLEELNTTNNINKGFDKVDKFISYYSMFTGDNGLNNIYGFGIKANKIRVESTKDIYDSYPENAQGSFPITEVLRNETGLGGDGTVPTKNLRLVPNDSKEGVEIVNQKFESREIQCNNPRYDLYSIGSDSQLYRRLGEEEKYQMCAHTNMPKAVVVRVIDDIAGTNLKLQERINLLSYLGYANYQNEKTIKVSDCNAIEIFTNTCNRYDEYTVVNGLSNGDKLNNYFEAGKYIHAIPQDEIENDNRRTNQLSIDFSTNTSVLRYDILSPINVLITDAQGRRIGIDPDTGKIINEIPGAWTSGDTAGSNEPEFFLIPNTGSGNINHKIETFGTGDGVYHIEMREIATTSTGGQENNGVTKLLTIAGSTKEGFGQEYKVAETQTGTAQGIPTFSYTNISDYPAKIETQSDAYRTVQDTFTLRYSVKGDGKNIEKIQVETIDPKGTKTTHSYAINGEIPLTLKEIGSTKATLMLLDKNGKPLTYNGAKKVVTVKKIENIAKQSATVNKTTLTQDSLDFYEKTKKNRSLFDFSSFFR